MTRVLVTGASGFVGRWLTRTLEANGDEVIALPPSRVLDLASAGATETVAQLLRRARPAVVVHLAAVAFGPDAARDPDRAIAVTAGGTGNLIRALDAVDVDIPLLVAGSSEVYGPPAELPLRETSPLRGATPYARAKRLQEQEAQAAATRGRRVVVTRAFNHTGPGQRGVFVAPALAQRIADVRRGLSDSVRIGNPDVRRDFLDVRDVVEAYKLLVRGLVDGSRGGPVETFNIASGRAVSIKEMAAELWATAGLTGEPRLRVDSSLVRPGEPEEIAGDASALSATTGWRPTIPLSTTLRDLYMTLSG